MSKLDSLKDIVKFNNNFKTAVNLYLSLNKPEKVLGYIPTKSSVSFMGEYLKAVIDNKEQATLMVGPYGKGKSHLLLVLLAVLSMERTKTNKKVISQLVENVGDVDEVGKIVSEYIKKVWENKRFLPVLITGNTGDLNQAFLYGLNDALKREGLKDLVPDTYYDIAVNRIENWERDYIDTYNFFEKELSKKGISVSGLKNDLRSYSKNALEIFKDIYPMVTAGSEFNPIAVSDVFQLYKNVSEKLVEEFEFSGIYIVFDEFSKFIESQNGTSTGSNMKLLQEICELATESNDVKVFFTMVAHKSIKEYGKYLSQELINSFTGIEGRMIEKYFVTSSKNNYELIKNAIVKDEKKMEQIPNFDMYLSEEKFTEYWSLPAFKSNFLENEFRSIVFKGCYPLNPIASYLLLNISEKVAQNERTLFTFISNDEPHSMARFVEEHTKDKEWSIGADLIYDYFSTLFKKEVANEYVHNIWLSAEYALDKCENYDQKKIIKALAIILIVNKEDEIPATNKYLKLSVNADDADLAINELKEHKFIYKKGSTDTYMFKTRAGSELRAEIHKRSELNGDKVNYGKVLLDITGKYYVVPRKYNTEKSMTRYFSNEFMCVDDFLSIDSVNALLGEDTLDGKIITLYSFAPIKQEVVNKHLLKLADKRLVVVCPKKALKEQKKLKEYEITKEIKNDSTFINDNEILKKELPLLLDDLAAQLEMVISEIYDEDAEARIFYYNGKKIIDKKAGSEETVVNECCFALYPFAPEVNNEMVNRAVIETAQTKKTRLNIIQAILSHTDTSDFYIGSNQEATIYRSLFIVTNIIKGEPKENIKRVIEEINNYVNSCCDKKIVLTNLVEKLIKEPYGMRKGLIPFYLAYVMANRREDIIVYFDNKELQVTPDIVVNMCEQSDDYSLYVSKEDLQKEKYITELNTLFQVVENRNLSSNRIKNIIICMQRWFRALPQATRNIVNIEQYISDESIIHSIRALKKAMQKVEYNPFEILFVDFPDAFGTKSLEDTFYVLDECKTYFDDYFTWIENQAVSVIYDIWDPKRKQQLYHTLKEWYDKQSKRSKQEIYDGRTTKLMTCLETLDVYSDQDVASKIEKAITDVYIENWNTGSLEEFKEALISVKKDVESIRDEATLGEYELTFTGRNGKVITKLYNHANEAIGSVLKNIIEDSLEEYSDLSINDRVSILLEMIEKIIK